MHGKTTVTACRSRIFRFFGILGASVLALAIASEAVATTLETSAPRAKTLVRKTLELYRELDAYSDTWSLQVVATPPGQPPKVLAEETGALSFQRPGVLRYQSPSLAVAIDGNIALHVGRATGQYRKVSAPTEWRPRHLEGLPEHAVIHPVALAVLSGRAKLWEIFPDIRSYTDSVAMEIDGRPGYQVSGELRWGAQADEPITFTFWIDEATGFLRRAEVDLDAVIPSQTRGYFLPDVAPEELKATKMRAVFEIHDPKRKGTEVAIALEGFEEVPELLFPMANVEEQPELVGKPAPPWIGEGFSGPLKGQPVGRESLKGQVTLIDFWATWCPPCIAAFPDLRKLHEEFAEEPFALVGISQDKEITEAKLQGFLKKHKVAFTQVWDQSMEIGQAFEVTSLPTYLLVDADGIVRDLSVGMGPTTKDRLRRSIRALLDGKELPPPPQPTVLEWIAAWGAELRQGEALDASLGLKGHRPERIQLQGEGRFLGEGPHRHIGETDMDGDGVPESVIVGPQGNVMLVSSEGKLLRTLWLKTSDPIARVYDVRRVNLSSGPAWAAVFQTVHMNREIQRPQLGVFTNGGRLIWQFNPWLHHELAWEMDTAWADLDGDGKDEVTVLLSVYEFDYSAYARQPVQASLSIFDEEGHKISKHNIGKAGSSLRVADAASEAPGIRCLVDGAIRTYTLVIDETSAKPPPNSEALQLDDQ